MYETKSVSLKSFVEDESIKLPRFQRKLTWDKKKNFYLAVSVIKNYPLGVTILRVEQDNISKTYSKWLLDGRQRRNALTKMLTDPVEIYEWARAALSIKANDNSATIKSKFRAKIDEYIEYEPDSEKEKEFELSLNSSVDEDFNESGIQENSDNETVEDFNSIQELDFLLNLIIIAHTEKTGSNTGITAPFVKLKDYVFNELYYFDTGNKVNPKKLRDFIDQYKKFCMFENISYAEKDSFKRFIDKTNQLRKEKYDKFGLFIDQSFKNEILKIIDVYTKLNDIFSNASIGTIEIRDIKDGDAQKIFNLINTGGTKLTAAEILAARPAWNRLTNYPSQDLIKVKTKLYEEKSMKDPEGVTHWDVAATFIMRLENLSLFFNEDNWSGDSGIAKKITISFKLLSAILTKGIKKEDIDEKLASSTDWINQVEQLVRDLNIMFGLLKESPYFSTLSTWDKSISSLVGDSPTLYFIAKTLMDWREKGKPMSVSSNVNKFKKNAFILFDQIYFEFLTRQWRASSDSKANKNLQNFIPNQDVYQSLHQNEWLNLIENMFLQYKIGSEELTSGEASKILYHYYAIKGIKGPNDSNIKIEVDHIYPRTLIEESQLPEKNKLLLAPFNFALLPKKNNISKGRKKLIELSADLEMIEIIERYEEITKDRFEFFSNLNNWPELQKYRHNKFIDAFSINRNHLLNN